MKKHIKVFSATTFQIVSNQLFGLLFFVLMSSYIGKDIFGDINWSIAVSVTISIMLSFGFDHVIVRKIAAGGNIHHTAGIYLGHTILVSAVCLLLLLLHHTFFPGFYTSHIVFVFVFISTLISLISGPYKQLAMGLTKFWHLALMSVSCNFIRISVFFILLFSKKITTINIGLLFLFSSCIELVICFFLSSHILKKPLKPALNKRLYASLVRESLPQTGTVLLDSAFARMDWILMGLLSTKIFTADYSFSYKAFESSRLPLLIIAPVLLPRLSGIYSKNDVFKKEVIGELNALWKIESAICVLVPLLLNVCWVDIINLFTHNKYGLETKWVYLVLSMAVPMLFITNYLWTIAFAAGRLKLTFKISASVTLSNLILNVLLIPRYQALGAAIASTGSIFLQVILYCLTVREKQLRLPIFDFLKSFFFAGLIIAGTNYLDLFWMTKLGIALITFFLLITASNGQFFKKNILN